MSSNSSNRDHLSRVKKLRKGKNGGFHPATYHVNLNKPNTSYSSSGSKDSLGQMANSKSESVNSKVENATYTPVTSFRDANPSSFEIKETQNFGGSGKPPTNNNTSGAFSHTPDGPNYFTFLDQTDTPRAPRWGAGPTKHAVSQTLSAKNTAALEGLSRSFSKVNQKFSSSDLKNMFAGVQG
jgi:hypothetical protein